MENNCDRSPCSDNGESAPLIAHIIFRLGVGGLENGLVNLINQTSPERYTHVIVCLKDATNFRDRIHHPDVRIYTLNKREGHDWGMFFRLYQLLGKIRPAIVHTRNLATIECQMPAFLARVQCRVHGEHGWDIFDPMGKSKKYQWLRRIFKPLVHCYIPLSKHLESYLRCRIKVPKNKITRICNGVDTDLFFPPANGREMVLGCPFTSAPQIIIGTVGRMHGVKDQLTLVKAFIHLIKQNKKLKDRIRLILVGDGPLRSQAIELLEAAQIISLVWLPGERGDVDRILRSLDIFVLPSQAEGISNTVLEAMATGLPVVATNVGGNPDLVLDGKTGFLVAPQDPIEMADAIDRYLRNKGLMRQHGKNALQRVRDNFSLRFMVDQYLTVYDNVIKKMK